MTQFTLFNANQNQKKALTEVRNFLAGRSLGITRDEGLLEELIKIIFTLKHGLRKKLTKKQLQDHNVIRNLFSEIKQSTTTLFEENEEILLDPASIKFVVNELFSFIEDNKQGDLIADSYEIFIGNAIKGQEGQFFTPQVAIDYLINAVKPNENWKIIDTACGAGGFLSSLYFYFLSKKTDIKPLENNLFGIDKDKSLARLARIHLTFLFNSNANILSADSLSMKGDPGIEKIKDNSFDLVITNPPFGAKIKSADLETRKKYALGHKWKLVNGDYINSDVLEANVPPQVLFMERNIRLLKEGGILATVIPESLISNRNYKHVVKYLLSQGSIDSIISMPESLFKISCRGGTHTKTSLLIFKKGKSTYDNKIFMGDAKWCGHDSRGNKIPNNDVPDILKTYEIYKDKGIIKSELCFEFDQNGIEDFILAPKYYSNEIKSVEDKLSKEYLFIKVQKLVDEKVLDIHTGDEVGKLAYGTGSISFIRTSDISDWEIKSDSKHKLANDVYEKYKKKQDVKAGDLLLVKDGTYLIGNVAIVTDSDVKMVYQSHLFKIRVLDNDYGLDGYSLLSLMSSDFVYKQIKSKQLTQDIIDSLGKRLFGITLAIPKDPEILKEISKKTAKIIDLKMESKNLRNHLMEQINSHLI